MSPSSLSRRQLLQAAGVAVVASTAGQVAGVPAAEAAVAPARADIGVSAYPFELGQVRLTTGRWLDNQNRTLSYLRFIDVDRLLYNFRANHRLSTQGAAACGGWESPTWEFRSHSQGHFLSAWAQAYAVLGDTVCRDKAAYMVAELAKCQANNAAAGFNAGYLSGFPESDLDTVETGVRKGVPYYCLHKTLAGLLDVWRYTDNTQARDVLLRFAGWVDWRTGRLSQAQMQTTMTIEFGGMNAVLADLYQQTGDARWMTVAQRFDHAAVFDPLAAGQDRLNGLHANTQIPKWVGAAREYKATGTTRYRDIAVNAWNMCVAAHTYAIGGNSQGEHFRAPNAIAAYLTDDTCESCNTYNMLKLTRELFLLYPDRAALFDYYEQALLNQLIGQQNPSDAHGHVCYFTPLRPGGRRTYSNDYNAFTCCQGTGLETQTKLMDSIYFHNGTTLTVNLFAPSVLNWTQRGITVTQTTSYPASDTTTLRVTGGAGGSWPMRIRIPGWTAGATISVNGVQQNLDTTPGTYAVLTRSWTSGDTVTVRLPMRVIMKAANDNPNVSAITYGPVVLSGNYGGTALPALPALNTTSITRTSGSALAFTATANSATVNLIPFYDAHGHNYTVYWNAGGQGGGTTGHRLVNATSGLVLGIQDMSTADGGLALQWGDTGTADHDWELIVDGAAVRFRNVNSGRVLGVENMSVADNARVLQWADNGTADHRWTIVDVGDGSHKIRNVNSGKLLAILNASTAAGAQAVQDPDNGTADNQWRFVPNGARRIQNLASGLVLGVQNMSTADGGLVIQWGDNGTADHLWTAVVDSGGYLRLRNSNSGKVLGVENAGTAAGARVLQWADNGTADHRWRLRYGAAGHFRIQCANGGRVLGLSGGSTAQGAQVVLADDTGADDRLWRFV
ncbi:beta-L-arabinofuranosidase domain-containing protein [Streptosporangium sp. NPDC049644]|uniref:beta-L-arabinofuranosidase domain-containing protein n=1 Tax=Streptosporangium sp. NPDC049644 TaxID=3155507 RepID=UPI003415C146